MKMKPKNNSSRSVPTQDIQDRRIKNYDQREGSSDLYNPIRRNPQMDGMTIAHASLDYEQLAKNAIDDLYADIEGRNLGESIQQLERVQQYINQRLADLKGH